ncbi:MAG: YihA family ribosome biogenesis GTP-binding protein [Erysipelotrichaceae bacterium]|nr:YihA family ribosome biogenesis GTP-binding protein [Erysipelotrichaceae bacterium]
MQYHDAKLLATAANKAQWPPESLPEIIFCGRSNAGKSTLINALVNRKNLAYSGKTPGKTRLLNFFTVDGRVIFTDAPGYGYATSDKASALQFEKLIDPYFRERQALKGMILVADARRVPNDDDISMVEYGRHTHKAIIVACTKADKLSHGALMNNMNKIASVLGVNRKALVPVSAMKKQGIDELWAEIDRLIG